MIHWTLYVLAGMVCLGIAVSIACRPARGAHAAPRSVVVDTYPATLAPLPAPQTLSRPRACPDVPGQGQALSVALSAIRHPCYQYAARLTAMSWQSHKTLQRNYDVLAFATVARSYYRMGATYAG